jgi:membrane fusion protein (multidrug efflux system)
MKHLRKLFLVPALIIHAQAQQVEVVKVTSKSLSSIVKLPGEFLPYESVSLHARTAGYVELVLVDRGSVVKQGQLLVKLSAPEMAAQVAAAQARVEEADGQRVEAVAQLASAQSTYDKLKKAAETPGAIAGNELVQAEKSVDAAKALLRSRESAVRAAQAAARASKDLEQYLSVTAPFAGVISNRYVHPGALVGPGNGTADGLLELQQVSRLRLVVAVPETNVGGIVRGGRVNFSVPAYSGQTFSGVLARVSPALDPKTRTMSVELDVQNPRGLLSPGMYPEVSWPVHSQGEALLVPRTSVVTTTERTFVIRVRDGRAEWVNVKRGATDGDLVQIEGPLQPGDVVVRRGTDEIREGSPVQVKKGS